MTTYYIDQKITFLVNQYFIYRGDSRENAELVAFVQQKRLAMREKITFYKDQTKKEILFSVKARQVMDFGAKYEILADNDTKLGVIQKAFKSSLFRSTWHILDENEKDPIFIIQERSKPIAIGRRVWDFIPFIGEVPFLFKYHFDFNRAEDGERVATFQKVTLLRDHYSLQIDDEKVGDYSWQTFIALGVMLDALQAR